MKETYHEFSDENGELHSIYTKISREEIQVRFPIDTLNLTTENLEQIEQLLQVIRGDIEQFDLEESFNQASKLIGTCRDDNMHYLLVIGPSEDKDLFDCFQIRKQPNPSFRGVFVKTPAEYLAFHTKPVDSGVVKQRLEKELDRVKKKTAQLFNLVKNL